MPSLPGTAFHLLETMRLDAGTVVRLDRHLRRIADSARYFGYACDEARVWDTVQSAAAGHPDGVWRLRLTLSDEGIPAVTVIPHEDVEGALWRVAFANAPVDSGDPFLLNKTTQRDAYDTARRGRPDVDDVLLWNERRELTESTIANVVVEIDGRRCTPPVACGLLAGVLRGELLERGEMVERVITRGEVVRAERLWLINSVRGWVDAVLVR
jgi:para-aminobenzoate synthetase / 4-amino-4-deoxychorismate lyase